MIKTRYKDSYTPTEVAAILEVLNIPLEDFGRFIYGQGCPIEGGIPCYYKWDIQRFIDRYKDCLRLRGAKESKRS